MLRVDDIASYLAQAGWHRAPQDWHGAGVWSYLDDYELLVPARDGLRDAPARINEILRCLSILEHRPAREIADEIARPDLDTQYFKTFPEGREPGWTSIAAGMQAIRGVRDLLAIATRTVLQGPHFAFKGRSPSAVAGVLQAAELGPTRAGSYIIEVRLSATAPLPGSLAGRAVLDQMHEAVTAARSAVDADGLGAFADTVTAGVSANLCAALSLLGGPEGREPFEIGFRWARARPAEEAAPAVHFPAGAGELLARADTRLRHLDASGPAAVSGVVETLHDGPGPDERWRISVRGELRTGSGANRRRKIWVRLPDQATYERASDAHHARTEVEIEGVLSSSTGRVELVPNRTSLLTD